MEIRKHTTLNELRKHSPCESGWKKLLSYINKIKADDEEVPFSTILESNGIEDAVWCLRVLPFFQQRHFRADVAESVLHIFESRHPDDGRPREAINALRAEPFDPAAVADAAADADAAAAAYAAYAYADVYAAYAAADAYAAAAADVYAAAAAAYAAADAYAAYAADAAADAYDNRKQKWQKIEGIFKKYYCE